MLDPVPRSAGCPSDLELEEYWYREPAASRLAPHVERCRACAGRLSWMGEAERAFRETVRPATLAAVVAGAGRPRWIAVLAPVAAAAAMIAVVGAVVLRGTPGGYVGQKGAAGAMEVWIRDGGSARRLADGAVVHPGDALRFVVRTPGRTALVFTVDALGRVSRLHPVPGGAAPGADGVLPGGAVLDATLGPERVFAVYLPRGVAAEDVEAAARAVYAAGAPAVRSVRNLPVAAEHDSLLLEKVAPSP